MGVERDDAEEEKDEEGTGEKDGRLFIADVLLMVAPFATGTVAPLSSAAKCKIVCA